MLKKIKRKPVFTETVQGLLIILFSLFFIPGNAMAETQRTVTDMTGRQVTLPREVNRIIPTFKPVTLCILSLGTPEQNRRHRFSFQEGQTDTGCFPRSCKAKGCRQQIHRT